MLIARQVTNLRSGDSREYRSCPTIQIRVQQESSFQLLSRRPTYDNGHCFWVSCCGLWGIHIRFLFSISSNRDGSFIRSLIRFPLLTISFHLLSNRFNLRKFSFIFVWTLLEINQVFTPSLELCQLSPIPY